MHIGSFKTKKKRFRFYSITNISLVEDEITVNYINKVSTIPRIPNRESQIRFSGKAENGMDGYTNRFKTGEMLNVKLKYVPCFTWSNIVEFIILFIVAPVEFVCFNVFDEFFILLLFFLLLFFFFIWVNSVQVLEITLKNKAKVIIPVFAYMFPIFDEERKQEIHRVYNLLRSLTERRTAG